MKIIYTLALSFIALSIVAQPTITTAWVPDAGIQIDIIAYDGTFGLTEGPAGANQVWDLTGNDTVQSQIASYINPSTAPMASSFSSATDVQEGLSTAGNNSYTYDRLVGNAYQLIGFYQPATNYLIQYSNPQDVFHFPETFGNTFSDISFASGTFNTGGVGGTAHESILDTVTADAYGTLTTASGTFTDALRFHIIQIITDTVVQAGQTYIEAYHYETFEWLSPSHKGVILASINHPILNGNQQPDQGFYSKVISTGINDLAAAGVSRWSVSPVPASDRASVTILSDKDGTTADILVHDLTGRLVSQTSKTLSNSTNKVAVDVSTLSNGMYTISVAVDGKSDTQKLVVKH